MKEVELRTCEIAENGVEMQRMTCGLLTQPGMFLLKKLAIRWACEPLLSPIGGWNGNGNSTGGSHTGFDLRNAKI